MVGKEITLASSIMRSIPVARRRADVKAFGLPAVFAITLVAIGLISMLYLAQMSAVATAGYDIKRLEDQKAQWQAKNAQLGIRIAQLQSLERINADARARLKMGPPTKILYVPVNLQAANSKAKSAAIPRNNASSSAEENIGTSKAEKSWLNALLGAIGR